MAPADLPWYTITVMADTVIFANPLSGRGRGVLLARRLEAYLRENGLAPLLVLERADRALLPEPGAIRAAIVIGGDGTLHTVAARLVAEAGARGLDRPPFPLVLVGMGTANLMAQHLGHLWPPGDIARDILRTIHGGRTRTVDVAATDRGICLLMAGVGLDGAIIHRLQRRRVGPITLASYLRPTLESLLAYDFPALEVRVDGRAVFGPRPGLAFIGNVPEYGIGIPLLREARSDDGLLDVLALPAGRHGELWQLALGLLAGNLWTMEDVVYTRGRQIEVVADRPVPVQIDGEAAGWAPLRTEIGPVKLEFAVPAR
jgi:diacylglycerol kinase (ATP)